MTTKNTWYCEKCQFDVFNSKKKCSKCLTPKPLPKATISYDPEFDKETHNYYIEQHAQSTTFCKRCLNEGRILNRDPPRSVHNCWKYS